MRKRHCTNQQKTSFGIRSGFVRSSFGHRIREAKSNEGGSMVVWLAAFLWTKAEKTRILQSSANMSNHSPSCRVCILPDCHDGNAEHNEKGDLAYILRHSLVCFSWTIWCWRKSGVVCVHSLTYHNRSMYLVVWRFCYLVVWLDLTITS